MVAGSQDDSWSGLCASSRPEDRPESAESIFRKEEGDPYWH
jgi:hypothetical protein